ncbi:Aste57867_23871 [Aphanomyces stellatus]|uniref:Aste57867_23871 protein n=1 Tax=Aphanomyces stellatus TaxID=120398 RepID=A0A485LPY5_9STRA|nr:hypothetical protein As57867_023798 [Aphanomyces stellatus]VFU00514.1 Aste57867_23871 [Aphanomyces stellatus]
MGTDQVPSEPSMSLAEVNNDHVEITMHIPPGARTSEAEGPVNSSSGVVVVVKEKKAMMEPEEDELPEEKDYVDPTLFSAEVSRHSMDVAVRRARNLEQELRDMVEEVPPPPKVSYTTMLSSAVSTSVLGAMKRISSSKTTRYSLIDSNNTSPSEGGLGSERDITEGDGMQLSPVSNGGDGDDDIYLQRRSNLRSALRKISAYDAHLHDTKQLPPLRPKKSIVWTAQPDGEVDDMQDQIQITITQDATATPHAARTPKRPKAGVIRRLTPGEKEALYEVRPDLKIVPNWAQKYREEMTGVPDTVACNNWLVFLILFLMVLLVFLFYMIGVTKPEEV